MTDLSLVLRIDKAGDNFRHAAHSKVLSIELKGSVMKCLRHWIVAVKAAMDPLYKNLLTQGQKELFHVHGIHRITINFSYGESIFLTIDSHA